MPYLRQISFTGIPASASFKIATIWLSVMRLLIVKLLCFSLKEILRASCIILRDSYTLLKTPGPHTITRRLEVQNLHLSFTSVHKNEVMSAKRVVAKLVANQCT